MKLLVIFCAILGIGFAQPPHLIRPNYQPGFERAARILQHIFDLRPDGSYVSGFDTENGISAHEEGAPVVPGPEGTAIGVKGFFKHTTIDGVPVDIKYTADHNGYRPEGAILPTPPPIPPEILRSLAYNALNYHGEDHQPTVGKFK